jgi:hypothetical protein
MTREGRLVYFARCQTFIKIGVARDVYTRIKVLGTASPWPVTLVAAMLGGEREEKLLHHRFRALHHCNEWFREQDPLTQLLGVLQGAANHRAARALANDWYYDNTPSSYRDRGALGGTQHRRFLLEPGAQKGEQPNGLDEKSLRGNDL